MSYRPDRQGMAAYLATSPDLGRALDIVAARAVALAQAAAPIETGAYRASIQAEKTRGAGGRQTRDVVADVPYAADVEFRAGGNRPLTTALQNLDGA